jgi:hypothetical protein
MGMSPISVPPISRYSPSSSYAGWVSVITQTSHPAVFARNFHRARLSSWLTEFGGVPEPPMR